MDKKIIKGLIDEKLEVIQEQFSIIRAYEGKIPIIELDLILNSIRDLYELMLSLQIENMGGYIPGLTTQPEPAAEEKPAAAIKVEEEVERIPSPQPEPVPPSRISPVFLSMEPVTEPEEYQPEPPATPENTVEDEPEEISQVEKPQKITFDLFSETSGSTVADRLREGQDKRLADKLQENKIADLRTTIGINDKFLFINELFDGNMRIYDEIIQKLNGCTTHAQADLLMLDLKIAYNWDSESPTVKKFVELVRRKF